MNDFREYSAAFHAQNDDVFHYGTKGMHWDPSKRKKNTSEEDDKKKKKQAVVNATDSFSKGVSSGSLGLHLLKGLYDVVPKKKNIVNVGDSFKKTTIVSRKAPEKQEEELASSGGKRIRGKYKKERGRYKRGKYADKKS